MLVIIININGFNSPIKERYYQIGLKKTKSSYIQLTRNTLKIKQHRKVEYKGIHT